ncbi:MAG: hypothetical protein RSC31_07440 [Anaerovoracaceae bacterium]
MKKKTLNIIILAMIILIIVGQVFTIKIPFLYDSPLGDFLGKVAIIIFPIFPFILLISNYRDWKKGIMDTTGMIIFSGIYGAVFVIAFVVGILFIISL